jgi:NAD(P)H-flavin reductase
MRVKGSQLLVQETFCYLQLEWIHRPDRFAFTTGQFATLRFSDQEKGAYYAFASAPEENDTVDFLIKKGTAAGDRLRQLRPGDRVLVEGPLGKGFPIDEHKGRHLLLIGVGTGIAPLRSVYRSIIRRRSDFRYVHLYYGALTPAYLCYRDELRELRKSDIQVFLTVTTPDETWAGRTGFVQSHFADAIPDPNRCTALLVGMKEMIDECRAELIRIGLSPDAVLLNY